MKRRIRRPGKIVLTGAIVNVLLHGAGGIIGNLVTDLAVKDLLDWVQYDCDSNDRMCKRVERMFKRYNLDEGTIEELKNEIKEVRKGIKSI